MLRASRNSAIFVLVIFAVAASAGVAYCQVPDKEDAERLFAQGKAAYDAGNYQQALSLFRVAFREDPSDLDLSFHIGMAASFLGDYETANMAFDRVYIMNPDLPRVKLELGKTYFHLKLHAMAEKFFNEVLDQEDVPENVRANVEKYLARIRRARRGHFFSGQLSLTGSRDSNARISPCGGVTVVDFAHPIDIEIEADEFFTAALALSHQYRLGENEFINTWDTQFSAGNACYDQQTDLDIGYLNVATGPSWTMGNFLLDAGVVAGYVQKDYLDYLRSFGLTGGCRFSLTERIWFSVNARAEDRKYWQQEGNDGFNLLLTAGPTFLGRKDTLSLLVGCEKNMADDHWESYEAVDASIYWERSLPWGVTAYAAGRGRAARYDSPGNYSSSRRVDTSWTISGGVRRSLFGQVSVDINHKYVTAQSNIDLYDYRRRVTALSLFYRF